MPREHLHWEIITAAAKQCTEAQPLLQSHHALSLIGGIAPDAPYFYFKNKFDEIGEILHGNNGEDTWNLPNQLKNLSQSPETQAFLLGYLSHQATDQIFHPWIFNWTGNYSDSDPQAAVKARALHRLLETQLDLYWNKKYNLPITRLSNLLKAAQNFLPSICQQLNQVTASTDWALAFKNLAFYQNLFLSPIATGYSYLYQFINPQHAEFHTLFNCYKTIPPQLDDSIIYQHPITGEQITTSLAELRSLAIQRTLQYWQAYLSNQSWPDQVGLSLCFDLPGIKSKQFKFTQVPAWLKI